MKPGSSSTSVSLLWQLTFFYVSLNLASPTMSRELAPRQAAISSSSTVNETVLAGFVGAIQSGAATRRNASSSMFSASNTTSHSISSDPTPVPLVNSPMVLPSFSECTSGDTRTATFTSEFAHHTGYEVIGSDQEFWNDTGSTWVVKIVSPGYSIQGFDAGGQKNPLDASAISIDSANSTIAITVPTHGCESMCVTRTLNPPSLTITQMSAFSRVCLSL